MNAPWIMLTIAGLLEVGWSIGLKYTDGFNFRGRPTACAATLAAMVLSMYLLSLAVRTIPIGTGYAIWTGIGALGAATLGMILFREPATGARIACVLLIVAGIVGLKLTSPSAAAQEVSVNSPDLISFYVGGYGDGIGLATLDRSNGKLSDVRLVTPAKGASFLAIHPTLPVLYAVAEASAGNVRAFQIAADGSLAPDGAVASGGDGPCYVSVSTDGKLAFAANYGSGSAAAFVLKDDGKIGEPALVDQHHGSSVVEDRQSGPHAHSFVPDRSGRFAISADLGTDELVVYRTEGTTVTRAGVKKMPPGSGPRHIAFALDGRFVYVVNELANSVTTLSWDSEAGRLEILDSLSTLPADFHGQSTCAEVAMHPSGRFLYASNRGHNSIAVFRIDPATGRATAAGNVATGGNSPRHFSVDPSGRFMVVANQKSDLLVAFAIDPSTGMPAPTGSTAAAKAPSCVRFVGR